jgi:methyl-accepting chemotaxis protein
MLFAKLAVMNEHISQNLSQVFEITQGIDHSVGLAVQSLQFEDIVSQLLTHAERELSEQDKTLMELRERLENFTKIAQSGGDLHAALFKLHDHLQPIRQFAVFHKSKSVLQQSMDEGDVELF